MELKGKTAIVTGAGRGIGAGIAYVLAREGANVVINDIKYSQEADWVAQRIVLMGGNAIVISADVSIKNEVTQMAAETIKHFGAIDILVNNAGIESPPCFAKDLKEYQWDRVLGVNLKGIFLCCQAVIPQMIKQNKGRIVNIGSTAGIRMSFSRGLDYTVSKHGVTGLTQHLAWELADSNITVNAVCPGGVLTPTLEENTTLELRESTIRRLIPLGRYTTIEEIGEAVSFFASDRSAMITGQILAVDGGLLTGFGEDLRSTLHQQMEERSVKENQ